MAEEPRPLLYVVGEGDLTSVFFQNLPVAVKVFLDQNNVRYVSHLDEIPRDMGSSLTPVMFLTVGGLEGYVQKVADKEVDDLRRRSPALV